MAKKKYRGTVIKRKYAESSKSEHQAVMLDTGRKEFKLRRKGGNPFSDEVLDELVGSEVECVGVQRGSLLVIQSWKETKPKGNKKAKKENPETKKKLTSRKTTAKKKTAKKKTEKPKSVKPLKPKM